MPDGHRWSGYSHEELYRQINSGPGPRASHASIERWQGVSAALTEINAELHTGVLRSGATWEGAAADKARGGLNPLAAWADDARAGAEVMRASAEQQADHISKARADMPPPVPVTAEKPNVLVTALTNLVGGQTDYEQQEKAQNAAEQRAREVMTTYASSTASNTSTLGRFHQPPQLVISTPEVVRNDAAGVSGPGWAYGGPRGGRGGGLGGGRGGRGGGRGGERGGRGSAPTTTRPVSPAVGGSTGTSSSAGTAAQPGSTRGAMAPAPSTGVGPFGPGGVIGGAGAGGQQQDRRKSSSGSGSSSSDTTTAEQHGAAAAQQTASGGGPLPSGTTSVSSAEFGAFATANAQHASAVGPGGVTGALSGAGQAGGGDSVHKRSTPVPAQPAFDPFGGLGAARGAEEEEDATHDSADYLRETDDIYGVGGFSPAVIGESTTRR